MTHIIGRIFDIHEYSPQNAQIIIKKKIGDKIVPVAINIFGYYFNKIKSQGLKQGDKIKGKIYMKSKFWDKGNRYITDIFFKDVEIMQRSNQIQFSGKKVRFDTETGEIFDK